MLSWLRDAWERFLTPDEEVGVGAPTNPAGRDYPAINSVSAVRAFPLVRACFRAKAFDLAGLPLRAVQTKANGKRVVFPNHPVIGALSRPNLGKGSIWMRAQLCIDWQLAGDGYLYRVSPELGDMSPIVRLHPEEVELHGDDFGVVLRAEFLPTGADRRYDLDLDHLMHVQDITWRTGVEALLGTGAIEALHEDLTTDMAVRSLTTKAAQRGRLEAVITPRHPGEVFTEEKASKIMERYESNRKSGAGALVVGRGLEVSPVGLTPRDIEFAAQNERLAAHIMSVAGVPPVRLGMPTANYGTSKQQMRVYWEGLQSEVKLLDEQLSELIADPSITIKHDFGAVEALQQSRTERQDRTRVWFEMGASAKSAAAYENFDDAPLSEDHYFQSGDALHRPKEREPEEGQERAVPDALPTVLARYLEGAAQRYQARVVEADGAVVTAAAEEAIRLACALQEAGHQDDDLAERVAGMLDEAVLQLTMRSPGVVRIDIASHRAFRSGHANALAEQIQQRAGRASA